MLEITDKFPFLYVKPFFPIDGTSESLIISGLALCAFIIHLLLINAVIGTALLTFWSSCRAKQVQSGSVFIPSLEMGALPKCLALGVNLGVVPFLLLQLLYGSALYTSSLLGGLYWFFVPFIIIIAYYGLYFYTSRLHVAIRWRQMVLGISLVALLATAGIFVSNMTLMYNPGLWLGYAFDQTGTILATSDPQYVPRFLHVLTASLAVGGLIQAFVADRKIRSLELDKRCTAEIFPVTQRMRQGFQVFFYATAAQAVVGGWFLWSLSLPLRGIFLGDHLPATFLFVAALCIWCLSLVSAWRQKSLLTALWAIMLVSAMCVLRLYLKHAQMGVLPEALYPRYLTESLLFVNAPLEGFMLFLGSLAFTLASIGAMLWLYFSRKQPPHEGNLQPAGPVGADTCVHPSEAYLNGEEKG